jgi:hypothetical protein
MLAISRTPPFRRFQCAAGNATFHINTVIVGLELVARGGGKPSELTIRWKQPSNPRQSIEQTKQFVLLAVITHIVDSFDVLLRDYADLNWLTLDTTTRDVLRKSITRSGGKEYSIPDRTAALLRRLELPEPDVIAFLPLLVGWRNSLVHVGRAKPMLPEGAEERLKANASGFSAKYADIDIEMMLDGFWKGRRPTLKEATTMVAACQNLARAIDVAVIQRTAGTSEQISTIVREELAISFHQQRALWKTVWGRDLAAQTRAFVNQLAKSGITDTTDPVSAILELGSVQSIASSVKADLERAIPPPT